MSSSVKGLLIKDFNLLKGQKNFFLGKNMILDWLTFGVAVLFIVP